MKVVRFRVCWRLGNRGSEKDVFCVGLASRILQSCIGRRAWPG
jgi:hypothetical protein